MTFTPGPWSVHPYSRIQTLKTLTMEDGHCFETECVTLGAGDKMLGEVRFQRAETPRGHPTVDDYAEFKANAALVMAAPDLHAALSLFVKQWNACGPNSDFGRYFKNVRDAAVDALAKATPAPTVNCFGMKNEHRGWSISQGPDDNYYATGPNFDASYEGPEDGWVGNGESVSASTYDNLIEEIDNWIAEQSVEQVAA